MKLPSLKKIILNRPVIYVAHQKILMGSFKDLFKDRVKFNKDDKILDLACGIGQLCSVWHGDYQGLDSNEKALNYAHNKFRRHNTSFILQNILNDKINAQGFNKIFFIHGLHHFNDQEVKNIFNNLEGVDKKIEIIIIDLAPNNRMLNKLLLKYDQGENVRKFSDQQTLLNALFNIDESFIFESKRKIYSHSFFKCSLLK